MFQTLPISQIFHALRSRHSSCSRTSGSVNLLLKRVLRSKCNSGSEWNNWMYIYFISGSFKVWLRYSAITLTTKNWSISCEWRQSVSASSPTTSTRSKPATSRCDTSTRGSTSIPVTSSTKLTTLQTIRRRLRLDYDVQWRRHGPWDEADPIRRIHQDESQVFTRTTISLIFSRPSLNDVPIQQHTFVKICPLMTSH